MLPAFSVKHPMETVAKLASEAWIKVSSSGSWEVGGKQNSPFADTSGISVLKRANKLLREVERSTSTLSLSSDESKVVTGSATVTEAQQHRHRLFATLVPAFALLVTIVDEPPPS
ncbi:unnamed protein product [Hydatigera taeniaeformis]|uniref:Uncharacterized protein n=1 Tax=Hydatigena taeniaeformis TaxID=6205 RepID=A0A0R3XA77_HYDTA|nr:unnamed protein product [Hydatigera taeniaeformis]